MRVLVIPTNRPERLREFFSKWEGKGGWDKAIVVEDGPELSAFIPNAEWANGVRHFCWEDIQDTQDSWIFSRRDSAIRAFGFYQAWKMGAEYVLTLDDDCYPEEGEQNFFSRHVYQMEHPAWVSTCPGHRVRGLPYHNQGTRKCDVNVGLWRGIPDYDAVTSLSGAEPFEPEGRNFIVPAGQYVPMCGMNLCFTRYALPLMYFPLMGEGQSYRRFDDIWAGVIAKRGMDALGMHMGVGEPFVQHVRASNVFANLEAEAPGIGANEHFWEKVDRAELGPFSTPGEYMNQMGKYLEKEGGYFGTLGKAMRAWVRLLGA